MTISKELLKNTALKNGIELDDLALDRFDKYAQLLIEWNKKINLTAITEPDEIVHKHFIDSLMLFNSIEIKDDTSIIDVGTGAGFPGVALLIANPNLEVTLLDGTKKKLNVIENILSELGLSATIVHSRAEEAGRLPEYREQFDVVTARAVSNLRDLSEYCLPFAKVGGVFAPLKAMGAKEDLESAKRAIKTLGGEFCKIQEFMLEGCGERNIIIVKKISQTSPIYPRPSAQIAKNSLL
ncbi:MAG: 16S rRNA (guanine(527)-N(7))-methyltransferase RsmG [Clostridia bacterium]|nr:16S rRNA (guanine(527)-N(7))-methyltransferase RsmG [Clostridia bacterium]